MLRAAFILGFLLHAATIASAHDFVAVFFDDESARELKVDAPLPRDLVGQAITKLHDARARGLILKFFYDLPSDPKKDEALAKALCLLPTALQACLKDAGADGSTNALSKRFRISKESDLAVDTLMWGDHGYIPLPIFSKCARHVGFVDLDLERTDSPPLIEAYQDDLVKSLYVAALEIQTRETAVYQGTNVFFGSKKLWFNSRGEHPIKALPTLDYIPFHRILNGTTPPEALRDKIIILGYQGRRIHFDKNEVGRNRSPPPLWTASPGSDGRIREPQTLMRFIQDLRLPGKRFIG